MFRRRARGTETPSDPHRAVLTVASYNIHKGQGIDGRVDLMRIAAVIEELDADLVGVQEIYRPQAEMLAKRLGVEMHMGVTHTRLEGAYGNAVLTRLPARGSGTSVQAVSQLVKQFGQMRKLMQQIGKGRMPDLGALMKQR